MLIRKATMDDIEALRVLYLELEQDGVKYQPEHFVIGFSHVMILKQKNVACLKPQTVVYIQDLDVIAEMRSQGIGSLLMKASKEYGINHGADFIRTQVFPQNTDGLRFYEKNGFCEMMKTIECQFDK